MERRLPRLLACKLLLFLYFTYSCSGLRLRLSLTESNQEYSVRVVDEGQVGENLEEDVWFRSGHYVLHTSSTWFTSPSFESDSPLKFLYYKTSVGVDKLGKYNATSFHWQAGSSTSYITSFKEYTEFPDILVFGQEIPDGASNTAAVFGDTSVEGVKEIITGFPSFNYTNEKALNFLNYYGYDMINTGIGHWGPGGGYMGSTIGGSPLVVYDANLTTVVVSPLQNLMVGIHSLSPHFGGQEFICGLNGKIKTIPKKFVHETILVAGKGVTATFTRWGDILLKYYGKERSKLDANESLRKIGYVTGNGAYYYYNLPSSMNWEQLMKNIKKSMDDNKIPVAYYEFDSWWYWRNYSVDGFTGQGGVLLWEPRPDVFPDGMTFLNTSLWLHNRYMDPYNYYLKNYTFIVEPNNNFCALPVDAAYFEHIWTKAKKWGMIIYEQDWLAAVFMTMNVTVDNIHEAHRWLATMDSVALKHHVHVMWDSPLASQVMQSAEFRSGVQGSALMDYNPGNSQWKNGYQNLILWVSGLVPWKDSFWTSKSEPGCLYAYCLEPNAQLQIVVAVLTAGPVTLGDAIGYTNRTLVMQTCRDDGTILKPSVPLFPLDQTYSWTFEHLDDIQISNTHTELPSLPGYRWHYILSANLTQSREVTLQDLDGPNKSTRKYIFYDWRRGPVAMIKPFDEQHPLVLPSNVIPPWNNFTNCTYPPCNQTIDFNYYIVAPILRDGWVILGETGKVTTVASQRIDQVDVSSNSIKVLCVGSENEKVAMSFLNPSGKILQANCVIDSSQQVEITCTQSGCKCRTWIEIEAVKGLIKRLLPKHTELFQLELLDQPEDQAVALDIFEVQSIQVNQSQKIAIRGTSGVALASGLNWYLKYKCFCSVSWLGDNLNIPNPPPSVSPKVVKRTPYRYRYYYNVCAFGYSTPFWDWTQWEREIDWMALNGINMPLSLIGQESVWEDVYNQIGIPPSSLKSFFTGPAFLPWNVMGNIDGWGGPLPRSWFEKRKELQKKILTRQRSFGMTPVLPGFAGHVPEAFKEKYPDAEVTQLRPWAPPLPGTYFLDARDPWFRKIGKLFIKTQAEYYGTDHLYNADPFNELVPPENSTSFLDQVGKAIYASMADSDPQAVWILQGWFLLGDWWHPTQAKAFLNSVPFDRSIALDLWAEVLPVWKQTDAFYGRQFVWCMLHNFGGRSGMYGTMPRVNEGPSEALHNDSAHVAGLGLSPEGIQTNPVMYDLMADLAWTTQPLDLDSWVQGYAHRRYGVQLPQAEKAWSLLQNTVYNCTTEQDGASGNLVAVRPALYITRLGAGCGRCVTAIYYDPALVMEAWKLLLESSDKLRHLTTYHHDLIMVTSQVLGDIALSLHQQIVQIFNNTHNASQLIEYSQQFLGLADDLDELLYSNRQYLLGRWIEMAGDWGSSEDEKKLYETNARVQVTVWGPPQSKIYDYASKLWQGLVKHYYRPRWEMFFGDLQYSLENHVPFNQTAFVEKVVDFEYRWVSETRRYPTHPKGDTVTVSQNLFRKYSNNHFRGIGGEIMLET